MKLKSTNRKNWQRVPKLETRVLQVADMSLVFVRALEVTAPLVVSSCNKQICIMDTGFVWLYICKQNAKHILTVHCNEALEAQQYYVDIIDGWSPDPAGFPVYKDMYLDVIALSTKDVEVIDQDDLKEALELGSVSQEQFSAAWREAEFVVSQIRAGVFEPMNLSSYYLSLFS